MNLSSFGLGLFHQVEALSFELCAGGVVGVSLSQALDETFLGHTTNPGQSATIS